MTETEIQAALDRARGARKMDVCFCPADVEALVAEVRRLQDESAWWKKKHLEDAGSAMDLYRKTVAERDQLRARVAELEREMHESRVAWVEQQKHLRAQLKIAVEALEMLEQKLIVGECHPRETCGVCDGTGLLYTQADLARARRAGFEEAREMAAKLVEPEAEYAYHYETRDALNKAAACIRAMKPHGGGE